MSNYHFHKDCFFYPDCKEEKVTRGKTELVRFTCPVGEKGQLYYKKDLHTIKVECAKFEPLQTRLKGD